MSNESTLKFPSVDLGVTNEVLILMSHKHFISKDLKFRFNKVEDKQWKQGSSMNIWNCKDFSVNPCSE